MVSARDNFTRYWFVCHEISFLEDNCVKLSEKIEVFSSLLRLQVLSKELPVIRKACARIKLGYEPVGITFVAVQKRHHTRFFPDLKHQDGPKNKNVESTLVDNTITHLTELNFYLVSHQNIQVGLNIIFDSGVYSVFLKCNTYFYRGLRGPLNMICCSMIMI